MIRIDPATARPPPAISGLTVEGDRWEFDPDPYHAFIKEATGIDFPDDPTATDCYRIGNRLEALIEEAQRHDQWNSAFVDQYPTVSTLNEIVGLARFFRRCHESYLSDITYPEE